MFLPAFCEVDAASFDDDADDVVGSCAPLPAEASMEEPRGDDKGSSFKDVSDQGATEADIGLGIAALMLVTIAADRVGDADDIILVFVFDTAECSFSSLSDVKESCSWSWSLPLSCP